MITTTNSVGNSTNHNIIGDRNASVRVYDVFWFLGGNAIAFLIITALTIWPSSPLKLILNLLLEAFDDLVVDTFTRGGVINLLKGIYRIRIWTAEGWLSADNFEGVRFYISAFISNGTAGDRFTLHGFVHLSHLPRFNRRSGCSFEG